MNKLVQKYSRTLTLLFHVDSKKSENYMCDEKFTSLCTQSSVKWGHMAHLEPNSMNTIFSTNTMGSSSPL